LIEVLQASTSERTYDALISQAFLLACEINPFIFQFAYFSADKEFQFQSPIP